MTNFQLAMLAIMIYSACATAYIIFQTWQLHRSRLKRDELEWHLEILANAFKQSNDVPMHNIVEGKQIFTKN
jgi:hypothetical protein